MRAYRGNFKGMGSRVKEVACNKDGLAYRTLWALGSRQCLRQLWSNLGSIYRSLFLSRSGVSCRC